MLQEACLSASMQTAFKSVKPFLRLVYANAQTNRNKQTKSLKSIFLASCNISTMCINCFLLLLILQTVQTQLVYDFIICIENKIEILMALVYV